MAAKGAIDTTGQAALEEQYRALIAEFGDDFFEYDPTEAAKTLYRPDLSPEDTEPNDLRANSLARVKQVCHGEAQNAIFPPALLDGLTREEITFFETEGLTFSGISDVHPNGGIYVKGGAESSVGFPVEDIQRNTLKAILVTGTLKGATALITHPAIKELPKDLSGLKRFPMNSLVSSVYKKGEWTQSYVHPDGKWLRGGYDDAASQYGQGCFEGMVASSNGEEVPLVKDGIEVDTDNGKITMFRSEENAKRFIKSCKSLGMPPVSVNQFIEAVTAAVKNNKKFIPKNGKLYVRPFMIGLEGGTGVKPAEQYLFGVEVSPYGDYISGDIQAPNEKELPGAAIKSVVYERPVSGTNKGAGNYAVLLEEKEKAKKAGYKDILLLTESGKIQECASNNFFLVKHAPDGEFHFYTSSLETNILPGITRKSLIELLSDPNIQARLGANIEVHHDRVLYESLIKFAHGAFGTGTAAGISNFRTIRTLDVEETNYEDHPTQELIKKIYDLLQDIRRGKVPGYEHWVKEV